MAEIQIEGTITSTYGEPFTVEVERGQRGGYGWTIKVHGKNPAEILKTIQDLDQQLRDQYQPLANSQKGDI